MTSNVCRYITNIPYIGKFLRCKIFKDESLLQINYQLVIIDNSIFRIVKILRLLAIHKNSEIILPRKFSNIHCILFGFILLDTPLL